MNYLDDRDVCDRHFRYETRREAKRSKKQQIKWLKKYEGYSTLWPLQIFPCRIGSHYHVGHRSIKQEWKRIVYYTRDPVPRHPFPFTTGADPLGETG